MATKNETTVEIAESEIIFRRTINAPRELVFDAFTLPEHLEQWFGPHGFTTTAETDPKPQGKYRIIMHGTDALPAQFRGDYPMHGEYLEFDRPKKIVYTNNLDEHSEEWKAMLREKCKSLLDNDVLISVATVTFEDNGDKTLVTLRSTFASNNIRDGYIEQGMNQGWAQSFDRLEEYVERVPA